MLIQDQEWGERFCEAALQVDALEPEDAEFLQNVSTAQHRGDEQGSRDPSSVRTARYSLERLVYGVYTQGLHSIEHIVISEKRG